MIAYVIDPLPGGRGQLLADVLDLDGRVLWTEKVGSPAPVESIERFVESMKPRKR